MYASSRHSNRGGPHQAPAQIDTPSPSLCLSLFPQPGPHEATGIKEHRVLSFTGIDPHGHLNGAGGIFPMGRQAQRGYNGL